MGGSYRLGMKGPDQDEPSVVAGTCREVLPSEKLVYTWRWEHDGESTDPGFTPAETLVTVEFHDLGDQTELVLTHEQFPDQHMRDEHGKGWSGCIDQLANLVQAAGR